MSRAANTRWREGGRLRRKGGSERERIFLPSGCSTGDASAKIRLRVAALYRSSAVGDASRWQPTWTNYATLSLPCAPRRRCDYRAGAPGRRCRYRALEGDAGGNPPASVPALLGDAVATVRMLPMTQEVAQRGIPEPRLSVSNFLEANP